MRAVAYTRVSTEDQSSHGVSLQAQEEKIRAYAALYGLELVETISDPGFSAKNLKRPGIAKVLDMMHKKTIEAVIVAKLDRLTRSVRDLTDVVELVNKKGVALISVNEHLDTGSAAGRMTMNMLGVISQWERETIGERTATSIRYKKAHGQVYSGRFAPYGYLKDGGMLVEIPEEQKVVAVIMAMRSTHSLSEICRELDGLGHKTRCGDQWHPKVVRSIIAEALRREEPAGRVEEVGSEAA